MPTLLLFLSSITWRLQGTQLLCSAPGDDVRACSQHNASAHPCFQFPFDMKAHHHTGVAMHRGSNSPPEHFHSFDLFLIKMLQL